MNPRPRLRLHLPPLEVAAKPAGEPDAAMRRVRTDLMTLFWYGAMVGFMAAATIPPFPESRSSKNQG
jgi:hypothetical protein